MKTATTAVGDSHRFGQRVQLGQGGRYAKPRSMRLERELLDVGSAHSLFRRYLGVAFGLEITAEDLGDPATAHGTASAAPAAQATSAERDASPDYARAAGRLLWASLQLGLADLHAENFVICQKDGAFLPVPIDLEIALWDCASGIDTLLIPSRLVAPARAGLAGGLGEAYRPGRPSLVMDGLIEAYEKHAASPHAAELAARISGAPLRVLLRHTQAYHELRPLTPAAREARLAALGEPALLPEEAIQLDAGDIPYFFTVREESTPLRWFSAARETSPCDPGAFARKVEAARRPVSELAAPARLKRLATVTALQLARAFDWPEQEQQGERFRLRREGGQVTVETATLSGSAGREAATP